MEVPPRPPRVYSARVLTLGTAGHIDHGKSTLTRLLTGTDPDRLPEEKARGISIDLGFARCETAPGQAVGLVDVPGHERFVHNMVAGATGIQGYLLVLAADEGVMPQTREHLSILDLLGVREGLVVLSKADLADPDLLGLVESELRTLLGEQDMPVPEILAYSAKDPASVERVRAGLERLRARLPAPRETGLFRLPVDRVFSLKGRGTVVTGTVVSGRVEVGQELVFLPAGLASRVRSIRCFEAEAPFASAGSRAALNVPDLARDAIARGAVATSPGALEPASILDVRLRLVRALPEAFATLATGMRLKVHLGTAAIPGRLHLLEGDALAAGGSALAQLRLDHPAVAVAGDRFLVRAISPALTLGGGTVLEVGAPRYKRGRQAVPRLARIEAEGVTGQIAARLAGSPALLETLPELARHLQVPERELKASLKGEPPAGLVRREGAGGPMWGEARRVERFEARILAQVEAHHRDHPLDAGCPREPLAAVDGARLPGPALEALLAGLVKQGRLVDEAGRARRPTHRSSYDPALEGTRAKVLAFLERDPVPFQGLVNLAAAAGLAEKPALAAVEALVKGGDLMKLPGPVYAPAARVRELQARILALLDARAPAAVSTAEVKAALELSRKALIPLLEGMDEAGLTLRKGEGRIRRPGSAGKRV